MANRDFFDELFQDIPFGEVWPEPLPQASFAVHMVREFDVTPKGGSRVEHLAQEGQRPISI